MSNIDFASLNAFDYTVITIVALSTLFAFFRGFIHTVLSFVAWIGSIFIAIYLFPYIQPIIATKISNEVVANIITFMGIYFISLILIVIVNYQILSFVSMLRMGVLDKSLGFAFGLARGVVIVTLIFMVITFFLSLFEMRKEEDQVAQIPDWLADAQTYEPLRASSNAMLNLVPENFWKNAKDYTKILTQPAQQKIWRPEMDTAVSNVVGGLPAGIRTGLLEKYNAQNWSDLTPENRKAAASEMVDSYRSLVKQGTIKEKSAIPAETLTYLELILGEKQPTEAQLRKLKAMFADPAYNNGAKVLKDIKKN